MPDTSRRTKQVASAIRDELVTIARRELNDPRLSRVGMITFSEVELHNDHRNANVWVSFMGKQKEDTEVKEALAALESASGFIHRLLIKRLPLKVHPRLHFKFDPGFDRAVHVSQALAEAAEIEKNSAKEKASWEETHSSSPDCSNKEDDSKETEKK